MTEWERAARRGEHPQDLFHPREKRPQSEVWSRFRACRLPGKAPPDMKGVPRAGVVQR
jgi:hypothetical protein